MAARADVRDVFEKVSVEGLLGPVELQLAGELLGYSLSEEEVVDCCRVSRNQRQPDVFGATLRDPNDTRVTFDQFEAWWNSDSLNPGLVEMRLSKSATAGTVEGSGTLFG